MVIDSPHAYRLRGLQQGHDPELLRRAVAEADRVEGRGLTSVLTLKHLAHQTGATYIYLREIVQRKRDPYTEILRSRANGRPMRLISAPDPVLMSVQRWILENIVGRLTVHPASAAYGKGNSVAACARRHVGASWLVKMDVHNFFHSIDERAIYKIFQNVGYSSLVAFELSRICTRPVPGSPHIHPVRRDRVIESYSTANLGILPQGAPTSGVLANISFFACDEILSSLAESCGLVYTRYADDIVFSAGESFTRRDADALIEIARDALLAHGLTPHRGKTQVVPPGGRHIVLGLLVDGDRVRLTREFRQRVQTHIRGVENFGLATHRRHRKFASTAGLINHVNGLLAFAFDVDPAWAGEIRAHWASILAAQMNR